MGREIKFRAWDNKRKEMYNVIAINFKYKEIKVTDEEDYEKDIYLFGDQDNFNLMQFTGLKDKNGKEIFEGDIVRSTLLARQEVIGSIKYADILAVFYLSMKNQYGVGIGINDIHSWYYSEDDEVKAEVIGNFYKNPELLEEKK